MYRKSYQRRKQASITSENNNVFLVKKVTIFLLGLYFAMLKDAQCIDYFKIIN